MEPISPSSLLLPPRPPRPVSTKKLGKYEVGRLLGQGNFAKVYHASSIQTGESVAIKVIDKGKIVKVGSGMVDQIKREIFVMRLVRHPNIVRLYEVMANKAKIYLVMEYVRGGELFHRVARLGKLKEDAARKYFQQLISAVDFCHSRGVYHRDLKPENLLVDDNGTLKVTDFGLSALPQQLRQDGLLHTTCGTPAYVAPEVLMNKGYHGATADVWSCGVILFVLMAGYLPFRDANLNGMYRKIHRAEFKCPPWFSREVKKLMLQLLDPNPRTRITIPRILDNPWFNKGFQRTLPFDDVYPDLADVDAAFDNCGSPGLSKAKPACMNAFDIISQSPGLNLSAIFEGEDQNQFRGATRFASRLPPSVIVAKLEEIAKVAGFSVKKKHCKLWMQQMQGSDVGRKGQLVVVGEIFEVTPCLFLVELRKAGGDISDFLAFCQRNLRPALQDIALTWQNDNV